MAGGSPGLLQRYGRALHHYRWEMVVLWAGILVWVSAYYPLIDERLGKGLGLVPGSDSERVDTLLRTEFAGRFNSTFLVVIRSETLNATSPAFIAAVLQAKAALGAVHHVVAAYSSYDLGDPTMISADGRATYLIVGINEVDETDAADHTPEVRAAVASVLPAGFRSWVTGSPAMTYDIQQIAEEDLVAAETKAFPLLAIVMVLVFGALVAAGLPVLTGIVAVLVMLAAGYFVSYLTDLSLYFKNVGTMLGLGFGVDYSLLIVSRFREEIAKNGATAKALERTMATAGRAVLFSGVTVALGFTALTIPNSVLIRSIGVGGILIVLATMAAALTLLPAVIAILGERVNRPRVLTRAVQRLKPAGLWHRWALSVMRRPVAYLVIVLVVLTPLSFLILDLEVGAPSVTQFPLRAESRQGFDRLLADFGGARTSTIEIIVDTERSNGVYAPEVLGGLQNLSALLLGDARVHQVRSLVAPDPRLNITFAQYELLYAGGYEAIPNPQLKLLVPTLVNVPKGSSLTLLSAALSVDPLSTAALDLVKELREQLIPSISALAGTHVLVGGTPAEFRDELVATYAGGNIVIPLVLVATYFVLLLLLRSLILPLKTILENALSVSASVGFLVLVFQSHWFEGLLGFQSNGTITWAIPLILFGILFGLSMDYQIFILSRVKEEYLRTGDSDEAVALGLERTGGIVTSAALVMGIIFASFALSDVVFIREIGLGLAFAVFIDATLVRSLLVPASMRLLRAWNWYLPARLRARLPEVAMEE